MPSIPLLRTRTRALLIISFFVITLTLASAWTVSQRASNRSNHNLPSSSAGLFLRIPANVWAVSRQFFASGFLRRCPAFSSSRGVSL